MKSITVDFDVDQARHALTQLQPEKPKDQEAINALYPEIKASLDRGVTKKAILGQLAATGLKLHPIKFKKLLESAAIQSKNTAALAASSSAGG